jgi:hypothetical protein
VTAHAQCAWTMPLHFTIVKYLMEGEWASVSTTGIMLAAGSIIYDRSHAWLIRTGGVARDPAVDEAGRPT